MRKFVLIPIFNKKKCCSSVLGSSLERSDSSKLKCCELEPGKYTLKPRCWCFAILICTNFPLLLLNKCHIKLLHKFPILLIWNCDLSRVTQLLLICIKLTEQSLAANLHARRSPQKERCRSSRLLCSARKSTRQLLARQLLSPLFLASEKRKTDKKDGPRIHWGTDWRFEI